MSVLPNLIQNQIELSISYLLLQDFWRFSEIEILLQNTVCHIHKGLKSF